MGTQQVPFAFVEGTSLSIEYLWNLWDACIEAVIDRALHALVFSGCCYLTVKVTRAYGWSVVTHRVIASSVATVAPQVHMTLYSYSRNLLTDDVIMRRAARYRVHYLYEDREQHHRIAWYNTDIGHRQGIQIFMAIFWLMCQNFVAPGKWRNDVSYPSSLHPPRNAFDSSYVRPTFTAVLWFTVGMAVGVVTSLA